ncbi:MAG: imelysin family protein [Pseudomonadota bacterium]
MLRILVAIALLWPISASSQDNSVLVNEVLEAQILPGYRTLASESAALDAVAARDCAPDSQTLRQAYQSAFDAWIGVSHLRFGPSEAKNRAFALAFWPDSRGATSKTLSSLIASEDPVVDDEAAFSSVSVAARGFFALELLLYDETLAAQNPEYACRLTQAIAHDIALNTTEMYEDWQSVYGEILTSPGPENPIYFTDVEPVQELYKSLLHGLEFTVSQRLARPLGTIERPRPKRAEAWRSGRSLRNVTLSVEATGELAQILASQLPEDGRTTLNAALDRVLQRADGLDDPVFAGVVDPSERFQVELLQQDINNLYEAAHMVIGPALGVSRGFNSLDGD